MGRSSQCTPTKKAWILTLYKEKHPIQDIANTLQIHCSTVWHQLRNLHHHPSFYVIKPHSGRPRILSPRSLCHAAIAIESGVTNTAADVQRQLFPHVSEATIRRALHRVGLSVYIKRKKPFLKPRHKLQRRR
ncbi:hypothetical protein CERSUDRAFT_55212 [Gelatoporia subvermispora B]|uniref:Transposase Tc1-like domain-containing protein n=1 Tax=Ceriporiopsis subvermispora (strain B) TaxID=914234 RepID=M2R7S1_CERS8|nr:hypothetical protein CERSUDRAFT_55212 [Gelatoporia subvermispora B]